MMTSKKYLIKLSPAGNFFFGGDRGFGDSTGKTASEKSEIENYLVEGNAFPQPTSVLGLLRYELLRKADKLYPDNKTVEAIQLVGDEGFNGNDKDSEGNGKVYGIIKSISPVFIAKGDEHLPIADRLYQADNKKEKELLFTQSQVLNGNSSLLKNYDPKNFLNSGYDISTGKDEKVFTRHQQVGIKKSYTAQTDDNAFFKQSFMRMAKGYCFAFYVEFAEDIIGKLEQGIVSFGSDQSLFRLEFSGPFDTNYFDKVKAENDELLKNATEGQQFQIRMLSDCKVGKDFFDTVNLQLSVNDVTDFRYLSAGKSTTNFAAVNNSNGRTKSAKQELLARNSVLFVKGKEGLEKVCGLLDEPIAYHTIGFNYYKIEKTNN